MASSLSLSLEPPLCVRARAASTMQPTCIICRGPPGEVICSGVSSMVEQQLAQGLIAGACQKVERCAPVLRVGDVKPGSICGQQHLAGVLRQNSEHG